MKVGGDPARVMVIAGASAGRQYASLHATLSAMPWVALREIDEPAQYAKLSARSILDQDVIVLIDLPPDDLDDEQWAALDQAARKRGASVVVCAGQATIDDYADHPLAEPFLPYDPLRRPSWRTWPGGTPNFRVALAAGAVELSDGEDRAFWRQLAPLSRFLPVTQLRGDARPLLVEREAGGAILTATPAGPGTVYFLATDQSWRWRGPLGSAAGREQFWPRLVRLAAPAPYAAAEGNLRLDVDDVAPRPGQPVTIRARALDPYGLPLEAPTQSVHVLRYGTPVAEVTLASRGGGSGLFEGTIDGLADGEYVLRLEAPEDPTQEIPPDPVELTLRVSTTYNAEMANLSGDEYFLRRIAESSGGQFLTLDQLDTLPRRLADSRQKLNPLVEYPLWDSPYLFVLVLACLSAEWALRKKFGLA